MIYQLRYFMLFEDNYKTFKRPVYFIIDANPLVFTDCTQKDSKVIK